MTMIVPTVGENRLASRALKDGSNQTLRLFVNNVTPSDTDTSATYTEMSTHSYSAKTLTAASWSISQVSGVAEAAYAQQVFSFTAAAPVTVYGYIVTDNTDGVLLWAETFDGGKVIEHAGDEIKITPKFTLSKV